MPDLVRAEIHEKIANGQDITENEYGIIMYDMREKHKPKTKTHKSNVVVAEEDGPLAQPLAAATVSENGVVRCLFVLLW